MDRPKKKKIRKNPVALENGAASSMGQNRRNNNLKKKKRKRSQIAADGLSEEIVQQPRNEETSVLSEEIAGVKKLLTNTGLNKLNANDRRELFVAQAKLYGINLWDRMPFETDRQYSYFSMFKELGMDRSLIHLESEAMSSSTLIVWKHRFCWLLRITSYEMWREEKDVTESESIRTKILNTSHRNLLRVAELNSQSLAGIDAGKKVGLDDEMMMHKQLFGEKKIISKKSSIDISMSNDYGDTIDI